MSIFLRSRLYRLKSAVACGITIFALFPVIHSQEAATSPQASVSVNLVQRITFDRKDVSRIISRTRDPRDNGFRGSLSITPDHRFFVGVLDRSNVFLYDLERDSSKTVKIEHRVSYIFFSSSSRSAIIAEGTKGNGLTVLDLESGKVIAAISSQENIGWVTISPDGERFAVSGHKDAKVFSTANGKLLATVQDCRLDGLGAFKFSPDSRSLLIYCESLKEKPLKLIDIASGQEVFSQDSVSPRLYTNAEFSPDGNTVVTTFGFSGITLLESKTGKVIRQFPAGLGAVMWFSFSYDGNIFASTGHEHTVRTWELRTGKLDREFRYELFMPMKSMVFARFSPDGKLLVCVDDRSRLVAFDRMTGATRFTFNEAATKRWMGSTPVFSPNGAKLFVNTQDNLSVLDPKDGSVLGEVPIPSVGSYQISEDGDKVFVADENGISIWKVE